jgi:tetratricopeptide (TPR) repeat protein
MAEPEDEGTAGWFLVDRMAVDPLAENRAPDPDFHKGHMRSLRLQREEISLPTLNPPDRDLRPAREADVKKAKDHSDRANRFLADGEPSKALLEMRDALTFMPDNMDLLRNATRLASDLKKFTMVETFSRLYLERTDRDADILALRAFALLRLSRVKEAQVAVDRALVVEPDHVLSRMLDLEMRLLREERDPSSAFWRTRPFGPLAEVTRHLVLHQDLTEAALGLEDFLLFCDILLGKGSGLNLQRIHEFQLKILDPALSLQFEAELENIQALKTFGLEGFGLEAIEAELLRRLGRAEEARKAWETIRSRYSEAPDAHLNYARYAILSGNVVGAEAALRECQRLLGPRDSETVRFLLATSFSLQGKIAEATEIYNDLARNHGNSFRSWMDLDPVFQDALNRMPNAKAILRLLEIPPESE